MAAPIADDDARVDCSLLAQLLTEALEQFDNDRECARRHIVCARALALAPMKTYPAPHSGLTTRQMDHIVRYVRTNIATKLRIAQIAHAMGMSSSGLSRAFKATADLTYSELVLHERITLAKRLLSTTDMPIQTIASSCGFTDQSHLNRLFKRAVGVPPGSWRRQIREFM